MKPNGGGSIPGKLEAKLSSDFGSVDQFRVFSSALSSSQVTELYNEHYQTKFTDGSTLLLCLHKEQVI